MMTSGAERGKELNAKNSGLSETGGPEFICIGKIHRTHGIKGDVILDPITDFPERIRKGRAVFAGEQHKPLTIARVREKAPYLIVGFKELEDETKAAEFRNQYLYVKASDLPKLPEGQYYFHQLIGLDALDKAGGHVGVLTEIIETGANDVYVIRTDSGKEELVPAIPQHILKVDIDAKQISIDFPEWI